MYAFSYWHTYYDSTFLNCPVKPSVALLHDLNISPSSLHKWPTLQQLQPLPKLFQLLERFIVDDRNWTISTCSEAEVKIIQAKLNAVMINLQCEKCYGSEFWSKSRRRIQSSVVHFMMLAKSFVAALIPEQCRNILEASKADKLTTDLARINTLVNNIMQYIKPIQAFMLGYHFKEQTQLTSELLQDFTTFIRILPIIKRNTLETVPKLMKYICIVNPLETQAYDSEDQNRLNRKRTVTALENNRPPKQYSTEKNKQKSRKVGKNIVQIKQQPNYGFQISRPNHDVQFFKFNEQVRKHSVYFNAKKLTVTTQQKTASLEKQRSPTHDRSVSIDPIILKSRTIDSVRQKEESVFYHRSRDISYRSIHSRKAKNKISEVMEIEENEHEREQKVKKKYKPNMPIKASSFSLQINLSSGKPKGWGVVREYFSKKVAAQQLRRLLLY